ncbi:efflux RND transporter periplasmic adaptor subunit [Luteolibacter pohnpeiensis]|uniref:Efflux RND transporter periplasmic adaptor subunit n=1 Tax=Luteolibacter pohnpeiensis TaxID=454153 RepID=A0A934S7L4_9BACT|nr:efflux RND transporter periplasmic adaptor subunit [Luteolibacter pohnpeiensis]MBK1882780.1 efflux RND transporter periplasmic adaptor subunit [Luteolibacter pohnpeiensis]
MKTILIILISAGLAAGVTWFIQSNRSSATQSASSKPKPLYYQSPMHPWIKSDKPGRCTICGMELTPIYPGEEAFDNAANANTITLSKSQIRVINVETAEAKIRPLNETLQVAGTIDDDMSRHRIISAYIDGRIEKLHINYVGAEVKEGQPLADFYSPSLLQAEREYRQLSGDLKTNTALRLRQMGLTPEQIDALPNKSAEALVSQILAPIGGTVVAQDVYEGQYVTTGQKLFEIADFSTMWFQFIAYESDLSSIQLGQTVRLTTPSRPGKTFTGKVTFIDPNLDPSTRSTQVRVEIPNPEVNGQRELLRNVYADAEVEIDTQPVLAIPKSAIIKTGPQAVVYVDQGGGAYRQVAIQTGRRGDAWIEVKSGLTEGDKVVTNGNLLIDGQAEMNQTFRAKPEPVDTSDQPTLSESQKQVIHQFLTSADAMAAALAADDLAKFNQVSTPVMQQTSALTGALAGLKIPSDKLEALNNARHFHGSDSIGEARSRFLTFTMAATEVLQPLRSIKDFPSMQIWQCPMVNKAVPDAGDQGRWIQIGVRPIQNPFFGSEMIDCGEQLNP